MRDYDVIVIGAGNGGLASAATLAEKGKSVILFEKHNIPGGCGTSFRRGRFEFEIALHQLSHMGTEENPGPLMEQFKRYGIYDEIEWIRIKELFRVNFPDGTGISLPADRKRRRPSAGILRWSTASATRPPPSRPRAPPAPASPGR